ncbi:DJ-1/PfpI family protein [Parasedimentitalea huanghaiensis]|uniref:Glutamine amidotransferase n=1 Tax=Parasedimentitalea huanghaiensis TaxID=2682100 RepID=A0A6L6WCD3_9RHOB|nr:DJ-1/PfpI family protein [Zongyanglinia huanghaiensis]MVO15230.1 glutamine amidotransferase [Zongyanglinia huanghaiensis]
MTKIAVVLTSGFADWEYALIAGTGGPFYGLEIQYFSPEVGQISSQGGLTTMISQGMKQLLEWQPAVVVIVGGTIWESGDAPDISAYLRDRHAQGATVAGICGGTLALARAGLLNAVEHTSNNAEFLAQHAENYAGSALFRGGATAVSMGRVISAAGTAPVSFTAAVFEAAGVAQENVHQFKGMMAAEHVEAFSGA